MANKKYTVTIAGVEHELELSPEDAALYGVNAREVKKQAEVPGEKQAEVPGEKQAEVPANKARTAPTK